jgi:hypothetical protein
MEDPKTIEGVIGAHQLRYRLDSFKSTANPRMQSNVHIGFVLKIHVPTEEFILSKAFRLLYY